MNCLKKIILPGIVAGIVIFILGMLVSYIFMLAPQVATDYNNTNIMRSWQDPLMSLFYFHPFVQGVILAWAWDKSKSLFKGEETVRAIKFGISVWLITTVPGMLITYASFPFSLLTIISWTTSGLVNSIAAGMVFTKLNK